LVAVDGLSVEFKVKEKSIITGPDYTLWIVGGILFVAVLIVAYYFLVMKKK
jgi:hypothetical protein